MANFIVNYDGSIQTSPQQLVYPERVEDIQAVLRDTARYPSPVRAMGSYHSLTPCVSSNGTILNMSRMNRVIEIVEQHVVDGPDCSGHYVGDFSGALT